MVADRCISAGRVSQDDRLYLRLRRQMASDRIEVAGDDGPLKINWSPMTLISIAWADDIRIQNRKVATETKLDRPPTRKLPQWRGIMLVCTRRLELVGTWDCFDGIDSAPMQNSRHSAPDNSEEQPARWLLFCRRWRAIGEDFCGEGRPARLFSCCIICQPRGLSRLPAPRPSLR
jgi:hypothetical protein